MKKYGWLTDLWSNGQPAYGLNSSSTYIETLFAARLAHIIDSHDPSTGPLYLQYNSHVLRWPLQVPQEWYDKFDFVEDDEAACGDDIPYVWPGANTSVLSCRRQFQAMLAIVDEVVGNVTAMLQAKGWWNNTLMLLTADSGGSISPSESAGSNYPLRGGKYQPMEGG